MALLIFLRRASAVACQLGFESVIIPKVVVSMDFFLSKIGGRTRSILNCDCLMAIEPDSWGEI